MQFIKKLTISTKLAISYLLIGIVTLLTVSSVLYYIFKKTIIEKTTNQLIAVNVIKKKSVEDFLLSMIRDVRDDEYQLCTFHNMDNLHILDNTYSMNSNDSLYNSSRLSVYEDVIFMDSTGNVLKHAAHSIFLNDSTLKQIQQQFKSKYSNTSNEIFFIDITNQYGVKHAQILCVFKLKNSALWGVYFINHAFINDIVEIRSGMGNTGESYLVGNDFYMRSRSRFLQNTMPSNIQVKTIATDNAFSNKGSKGSSIIKDYRGVEVISVYSKINIPGIDWVLISEMDVNEAMAPVITIRNYMAGVAVLISIVLMIVTFILVRRIVNPINNLTLLVDNISLGKFNQSFQKQNFSEDEIGKVEDAIINLQQRISATASFADEIGKGNLSADYNAISPEDTLGNALIKMRADLVEVKKKEKLLTKQRTSALIEGQEKERERLARELHDGLGQMLTAIRLRIGLLKEDSKSKKDIQQIIDDTIQELRRISNNVMPAVLIDFGLEAGLKSLVDYSSNLYHIPIQLSYKSFLLEHKPKYSFDINVSLYRIAQEAINNAVKYSNTSEIIIKVIEYNNQIEMTIRDNGIGFDVKKKSEGKGIGNMNERAKLIDGKFYIESSAKGTSISIFVPLHA
jgi:two-component system NarL family sensor kinase